MININNIAKKYDTVQAVKDLSLEIQSGELFGFLGPNGAGKTTTLKMVAGLLQPDQGGIQLGGIDLSDNPEEAKRITAYIPDTPYLYEKLTGREYLHFVGLLYDVNSELVDLRIIEYHDAFQFGAWLDDRIETYSHGMRQKIVFTSAFIHEPAILIVDEPMVGLDPVSIRAVKKLLVEKCKLGMTVLMSTHTLEIAQEICHRVGIIDHGEIVRTGNMDVLRTEADANSSLEDIFLTIVNEENQVG